MRWESEDSTRDAMTGASGCRSKLHELEQFCTLGVVHYYYSPSSKPSRFNSPKFSPSAMLASPNLCDLFARSILLGDGSDLSLQGQGQRIGMTRRGLTGQRYIYWASFWRRCISVGLQRDIVKSALSRRDRLVKHTPPAHPSYGMELQAAAADSLM